jgi:hypothetical protein
MRRAAWLSILVGAVAIVTFSLFFGGVTWLVDAVQNWQPRPSKDSDMAWLLPLVIWMAIIMRNDDPSPAIRSASDDIRAELRSLRRAIDDIRTEMVRHRPKRVAAGLRGEAAGLAMTNVTSMACYRPTPAAHLDDDESAVLRVVHDARGFFKSSGLSACDVMQRLKWSGKARHAKVEEVFAALARLDLVTVLPSGHVRRK